MKNSIACIFWIACYWCLGALAGHFSKEDDRYYYPEWLAKAQAAKSPQRTNLVRQTLNAAAGVYNNKTRAEELGITRTVFVTVIQYSEKSYYKLYLYNLLCFSRHYDIDIVIYVVQHHLSSWETEMTAYKDAGFKVLPYPDELFWSLLYSKKTEIFVSQAGRGKYDTDIPSFDAHGALVMLVPVLEVMLSGYNCIYFDVDIALVLDPVPYLSRGKADFVSSVEMRACPDSYTKTYLNITANALRKHKRVINGMESVNWYTQEPNTGILSVRSTEAAIGFVTRWLLHIIDANISNDQKSLFRDPIISQHTTDCVYGGTSSAYYASSAAHTGHTGHSGHPRKYGQLAGHHHARPHSHATTSDRMRHKWAANYSALVQDVLSANYQQPAKFCFVSELLFQNGQTAFTCGVKPSFKDSWILEMYRNGLQRHDENNAAHDNVRQVPYNTVNTPRFAVTVHANFADKKTHELEVRGLWLLTHDKPELAFDYKSTCRAYDPYQTMYATRNWTQEYEQVMHKRSYMYETFVQPGKLIQSTNGMEVFLVDENRHKRLIPDGDTFIAKVGDNKWGEVRFLPQPLMDEVPNGEPIPSVKAPTVTSRAFRKTSHPDEGTSQVLHGPAVQMPEAGTTASHTPPPPPLPPQAPAPPARSSADPSGITQAHVAHHHPHPHSRNHPDSPLSELLLPGMLARSESSATVFYIDKLKRKRRVQNMGTFLRLFGNRLKDVVTVPDAVLNSVQAGEPLVSA